jgi:hypothetical protein
VSALGKEELFEIGRRLDLEVAARMTVDELRDAIAGSKRARLSEIVVNSLSRETLKAICVACGLDNTGKEKAPLVERILAAGDKGSNGYKIDAAASKGSVAREGAATIGALLPGLDGVPVTDIRDQCVAAHVAFFFKQWGGTNKKRTGRTLDGRTWDEMPRALPVVP